MKSQPCVVSAEQRICSNHLTESLCSDLKKIVPAVAVSCSPMQLLRQISPLALPEDWSSAGLPAPASIHLYAGMDSNAGSNDSAAL